MELRKILDNYNNVNIPTDDFLERLISLKIRYYSMYILLRRIVLHNKKNNKENRGQIVNIIYMCENILKNFKNTIAQKKWMECKFTYEFVKEIFFEKYMYFTDLNHKKSIMLIAEGSCPWEIFLSELVFK